MIQIYFTNIMKLLDQLHHNKKMKLRFEFPGYFQNNPKIEKLIFCLFLSSRYNV